MLNGILWILRTGAPWRDLPERYGNWKTVYSRFRRWEHSGVWDRILTTLQTDAAHGVLTRIRGYAASASPLMAVSQS
jgi:transposase